jgi:hypothetical protein
MREVYAEGGGDEILQRRLAVSATAKLTHAPIET